MQIIAHKDAPFVVTQLVTEIYEGITSVKEVIFNAFVLPNNWLAAFSPSDGRVIIDLGHCMTNKKWMEKGTTFIANVWMNILYSIHHELIHACQIMDNPELIQLKEVDPQLEEEAEAMAREAMYSWFEAGGKIPPLKELGWVGEQIAETLNGLFGAHPQAVLEEMDAWQVGAIAYADVVAATHDHFNDIPLLYDEIDKGNIGKMVNGRRFLTATEFLEA